MVLPQHSRCLAWIPFTVSTFHNRNSHLSWKDRLDELNYVLYYHSLVAQRLKCLPAMQETQVQSLGWEDPLEKEMAAHSGILAWKIPWAQEPARLQSTGSQKSQTQLSN